MATYNVGPGARKAIQDANDQERSNEIYLVQTPGHKISVTYGRDALYYYYEEDNRVNRLPFDRPVPPSLPYTPIVLSRPGAMAGSFMVAPKGVILHGSRSGVEANSTHQEFVGTSNFAAGGAGGLGWNATLGDDEIAIHMGADEWGWNARGVSGSFLAVEFAQPTVDDGVSDGQVRAFCWFFERCRQRWPSMDRYFPTHAELDGTDAYGPYDGKTDVFPNAAARTEDLRRRINARLNELGVLA